MSAMPHPLAAAHDALMKALKFSPMRNEDLTEALHIENDVYPFPWSRGNFLDSIQSDYQVWVARDGSGAIAGYFFLMLAVDDAHLLNITVRRDLHGRGVGHALLDRAVSLTSEAGLESVLLEVRPSNTRAVAIYQRYGFRRIGLRKGYYPSHENRREDAIVMRFSL